MTELILILVLFWILLLGLYFYLGREVGEVCGSCEAEITSGVYRDHWTKEAYCSTRCAVEGGSKLFVYEVDEGRDPR